MISHPIQPVIIPLVQKPCGGKRLEGTEFTTQGELIGGIVLEAVGKGTGEERLPCCSGHLCQRAPLRLREGIGRLEHRPKAECRQKHAQQGNGEYHAELINLFHCGTPLKAEIKERIKRTVHQIGRDDRQHQHQRCRCKN